MAADRTTVPLMMVPGGGQVRVVAAGQAQAGLESGGADGGGGERLAGEPVDVAGGGQDGAG